MKNDINISDKTRLDILYHEIMNQKHKFMQRYNRLLIFIIFSIILSITLSLLYFINMAFVFYQNLSNITAIILLIYPIFIQMFFLFRIRFRSNEIEESSHHLFKIILKEENIDISLFEEEYENIGDLIQHTDRDSIISFTMSFTLYIYLLYNIWTNIAETLLSGRF